VSLSPFLTTDDVAERYGCSRRWVLERTRLAGIPHRRLPGSRRCLFVATELEAWENGAGLRVRELADGGRIVAPVVEAS
jgi:hypothetical protein